MAHATTPVALEARERIPGAPAERKSHGFGHGILSVLAALHAGIVASHRYETLRAHGASHPDAIDRAFAELGFGA